MGATKIDHFTILVWIGVAGCLITIAGIVIYGMVKGNRQPNRAADVLELWCPHCHYALEADARLGQTVQCPSCHQLIQLVSNKNLPLIVAGYLCATLAIVICPPVFGLAGFACGVANSGRGQTGHGSAQMVMAILFTLIGMVFGAMTMQR